MPRILTLARWNHNDLNRYEDTIAARLPIRLVNPSDKWDTDNTTRAIDALGLYVYKSKTVVMIDLKCLNLHSATLFELENITANLKRLHKKASKAFPINQFVETQDTFTQLTLACAALGITQSICYHGIGEPETFEPVGLNIKGIAERLVI